MGRNSSQIYSGAPETAPGSRRPLRIRLGWSIGLSLALSLILSLAVSGVAHGETVDPSANADQLIDVVFDGAELFTPEEEEKINLHAKNLLQSYGTAMAVEVVSTIDGRDIEEWTTDRANERRVGSSELNNGLFYGIALDDREFYVAKGDGYASIPDYKLQDILDREMVPRFKDGDFAGGIVDSSKSFGLLAVSPLASYDERAAQRKEMEKQMGEVGGAVLIWGAGILAAGGLIGGGFFTVRSIRRRKQAKEEHLKQEEAERLAQERFRIKQEEQRKRKAALVGIATDSEWNDFERLPSGQERRSWLKDRGIYAAAFDLNPEDSPRPEQAALLDVTLSDTRYGGIVLGENLSVVESQQEAERQERIRLRREKEARIQQEKDDSVRSEAQVFWRGLSDRDRREYGKLRSEQDRQRWVSDRGGANVFGVNSLIAFALFSSLSSDHARAERRAADEASRSSTDYGSSGSTDYGSSNMFGGGSFGGGGGVSGSW